MLIDGSGNKEICPAAASVIPSEGRIAPGLILVLRTTFCLARIFHTPSTAAAQSRLSADFSSVGLLDVVLTTPARPSVGKVTIQAPLDRLATNQREIYGLAGPDHRAA